jgi:hypothetical protein
MSVVSVSLLNQLRYCISSEDAGSEMTPQTLRQIFCPVYSEHSSRTHMLTPALPSACKTVTVTNYPVLFLNTITVVYAYVW